MKKLSILIFMALLPLMASAETYAEIGGIMYVINSTSEDWSASVIANRDDYDENHYSGVVNIPSSITWNGYVYPVTSISIGAFSDCGELTSVTIPSSVTYIDNYAFSGCPNLKAIYCHATEVPGTGWSAFGGLSYYTPLFVPEASVESYKNNTKWAAAFKLILPIGTEPPADVAINETNFPDENFRNFLLSQDYGADGALSLEELDNTGNLDVSNQGIQSMKGIEHFIALSSLYIYQNSIKGEAMDALIEALPVIKEDNDSWDAGSLRVMYNSGEQNEMTAAQVAAAKAKGWIAKEYNGSYWDTYDPSTNVVINETNFPDENFRSYLLSQTYGADGMLTANEASKVTSMDVTNKGIKSLKGIEYFTAMKYLYCSRNQIKGTAMDELIECLPSNTSSYSYYMYVYNNQNVDEQNVMTTTQVAAAKAKGWIPRYNAGREGWKDYAGTEPEVEVEINETNFPDANFRSFLLSQSYGSDGVITTSEFKNITYVDVSGRTISNLKGLEYFTSLRYLDCYNNQLTTLDVSKLTNLWEIRCYGNQIKGTGMDAFIGSLSSSGSCYIYVLYGENEGNEVTTAQSDAIKAKEKTPYYYDAGTSKWVEIGTTPVQKCATPTIKYENGKVTFSCATEGVKFHYYCYATFRADGEGAEVEVSPTQLIRIDVYASKDGYENSETEIAIISVGGESGIRGDVNKDGQVSMPDAMFIVNKVLKGKFPDEE